MAKPGKGGRSVVGTGVTGETSETAVRDESTRDPERAELEAQLRQAQKMEAVARLAGGVAHDFNNVLTVVTSYAALLQDIPDAPPDVREAADEIAAAARRGAALTRQLLLFGRRQLSAPRVVFLNSAVGDLEKLLRRTVGEDVQLTFLLASDPCPVLIDPGYLEQVLMNLVVNARDAMPRGGKLGIATADVHVGDGAARAPAGLAQGRYSVLSISDDGVGMAPEVREHLFEPFFTTKEEGKGTGLGLSTVHGIVKQARGDILVESEPGQGSTFRVYLPRAEPEGSAGAGRAEAGTLRVLVVEDDDVVRRIARRILEKAGYEVLEAASGPEAFALADKDAGPIDLLLADVVLPRINGFAVAERLQMTRPTLRVVYMSGYGESVIAQHGLIREGLPLVRKPFAPQDLIAKVQEALAHPFRAHP